MVDHPRSGGVLKRLSPDLSWPDREERALLGRFYVAVAVLYATWVVAPFEFAYLFLVMDDPAWAVIPLGVFSAVPLLTEVPTGVLADRWSRKRTVVLGTLLAGACVAAIPASVNLHGATQLLAVCAVFAGIGLGQTLMSGAQEAWVVDNLGAAGREDLVDTFFAKSQAVASLGAAIAAGAAVLLLVTVEVGRGLLDALWLLTAAGMGAAAVFAMTIPEHRPEVSDGASTFGGLRLLVARRPLLLLALAFVVATLSGSAADEVIDVSLITKGVDARMFGVLTLADAVIGVFAPLLGVALARRMGATSVLSGTLVLGFALTCLLFWRHDLGLLIGITLLLGVLDAMWDPVALGRLHAMIPSDQRATIGSAVNQASGFATVLGLGALGLVLGRYSETLQDLSPDLLGAFTGQLEAPPPAPLGWMDVPVPDLGLIGFVALGLLAVPLVLGARSTRGMSDDPI